jgi:hypothetical protein
MSIFAYYNINKSYWDELNTLTTIPECSCGALQELNQMQEIERVFQFLIGLNESYASIVVRFLPWILFPTLAKFIPLSIKKKNRGCSTSLHPTLIL